MSEQQAAAAFAQQLQQQAYLQQQQVQQAQMHQAQMQQQLAAGQVPQHQMMAMAQQPMQAQQPMAPAAAAAAVMRMQQLQQQQQPQAAAGVEAVAAAAAPAAQQMFKFSTIPSLAPGEEPADDLSPKRKKKWRPKAKKAGKPRAPKPEFEASDDEFLSDEDDSDEENSFMVADRILPVGGGTDWGNEDPDYNPDLGENWSKEGIATQRARRGKRRKRNDEDEDDLEFEKLLKHNEDKALEEKAKRQEKQKKKEEAELAVLNQEYEIEKLLAVRNGPIGSHPDDKTKSVLFYQVKWKGWEKPEDLTWEPEDELHEELVSDFRRDFPDQVKEAEAAEPAPLPLPIEPATQQDGAVPAAIAPAAAQ